MFRDIHHGQTTCFRATSSLDFFSGGGGMTVSTIMLAVIAFILFGIVGAIEQAKPDQKFLASSFMQGFGKTCSAASLAAIIAAVITFFVTEDISGDLSTKSLSELNLMIDKVNSVLKNSWIWILLACISLLLFAIVWGKEVKRLHVEHLGKVATGISITKTAFAVLAASSFVGAGLQTQSSDNSIALEATKAELIEARLALFQDLESVLIAEAISSAVATASKENMVVSSVVSAYSSADFLFDEPQPTEISPTVNESAKLIPDSDTLDVSLDKVYELSAKLNEDSSKDSQTNKLTERIAEIALDKSLAGPLKEHFLSFDNPIIDRLISNIVDPVFVKPLKARIGSIAGKWVDGRIDLNAAKAGVRSVASPQARQIASRLVGFSQFDNSVDSFGFEEWDMVRKQASSQTEGRTINASEEVIDEMILMSRDQYKAQHHIKTLLNFSSEKAIKEEILFIKYLMKNPSNAAIWGWAVKDISASEMQNYLAEPEGGFKPEDGFIFYLKSVDPTQVDRARLYFDSEDVSLAIERYCK
jgi:hypothetical protein